MSYIKTGSRSIKPSVTDPLDEFIALTLIPEEEYG